MKKIVFNYGIAAGLILNAMLFATMVFWKDQLNFDTAELIGYASMLIALSTIFFGVRAYRDKLSGGSISFGKALLTGTSITLVASFFYVAGWMIISHFAVPDFMDQYIQQSVEKLKASGESQEIIQQKVAEIQQYKELYKNPLIKAGITFMEIFPVGFVVALISAAILKKKNALTMSV
jgi:hypothetical protein